MRKAYRARCAFLGFLAALTLFASAAASAQDAGANTSRDAGGRALAAKPVARTSTGKRVALVIGNSAYAIGRLKNPVNDATALAQALKDCGFDVVLKTDATLEQMLDVLKSFRERLAGGAEAALFFFAGHGIQVGGVNYLVPVGVDIDAENKARTRCLNADEVLIDLENAGARVNVVILDACRNNPFTRAFSRSAPRGLAPMEAAAGTLIAYSTSPGKTAEDGDGEHSAYAESLLRQIPRPGLPVEEVFKAVRGDVLQATQKAQTPWETTSLTGSFYFIPPGAGNESEQLTAERLRLEAEKTRLDSEKLEQEKMQVANLAFDNAKTYDAGGALPTEKQKRWTEYLDAYGARYQSDFARERIAHWKKAAQGPQPGQTRSLNLGSGVTMDLVWIPGGTFQMGSAQTPEEIVSKYGGKVEFFKDERPVHTVAVSGFWMGKCEATNAQYRRYQSSHSSKDYNGHTLNDDNQPVVYVSWNDAQAFCDWLSRQTGETIRLPREAEWEYACRAATTTARYWGDDDATMGQYANVADRTAKSEFSGWTIAETTDGYAVAAPVGSFKPNAFGLYDMIGNVWEWCEDWYGEDYYGLSPSSNPTGPSSGTYRVLRGGSWYRDPFICRSSRRLGVVPVISYLSYGFRVVCVSGGLK